MPTFRTFEAWISVNGRRLPEYNTQETQSGRGVGWKVITCWVPSEFGQELKLHFKDSREYYERSSTSWIPKIDGSPLEGVVIPSGVRSGPTSNTVCLKDIPTSTGRRNLKFTTVYPAERREHQMRNVAALGDIRVKVKDCIVECDNHTSHPPLVLLPSGLVYERSAKAGFHTIQPGSIVNINESDISHTKTKDLKVLAEFIFKYRPIELLHIHINRPPVAPVPAATPHNLAIIRTVASSSSGTRVEHSEAMQTTGTAPLGQVEILARERAVGRQMHPAEMVDTTSSTETRGPGTQAMQEIIDLTLDEDQILTCPNVSCLVHQSDALQ